MCGDALQVFATFVYIKRILLLYMVCKFRLFGALVQIKIAIKGKSSSDLTVLTSKVPYACSIKITQISLLL